MVNDSQLRRDVVTKLNWEPSVDSSTIDVRVSDGIVTLTGHVRSYAEWWHAAHAARRAFGVRALAVAVEIVLPSVSVRTDSEIACAAERMLRWASDLPTGALQVWVDGGRITLSGEARWEYQRQIALYAMRYLDGVTGVSDRIKVRTGPRTAEFEADAGTTLSPTLPGFPALVQ